MSTLFFNTIDPRLRDDDPDTEILRNYASTLLKTTLPWSTSRVRNNDDLAIQCR